MIEVQLCVRRASSGYGLSFYFFQIKLGRNGESLIFLLKVLKLLLNGIPTINLLKIVLAAFLEIVRLFEVVLVELNISNIGKPVNNASDKLFNVFFWIFL
jgi:hypothetical protein